MAGANGGLAFFAYCTNYLIGFKHAVIVDAEATYCSLQAEVTAQERMIDRTWERFGLGLSNDIIGRTCAILKSLSTTMVGFGAGGV